MNQIILKSVLVLVVFFSLLILALTSSDIIYSKLYASFGLILASLFFQNLIKLKL